MRTTIYATMACAILAGCTNLQQDSEATQSTEEALDITNTSGLTKMQGTMAGVQSEAARQKDTGGGGSGGSTGSYYESIKIGPDGVGGASVKLGLDTLKKFQDQYGFPGGTAEKIAKYYNRGDLGIGREMHCIDKSTTTSGNAAGTIACYVKNFFAGDANTEFGFGLSSNIAFANMDANKHFATVAMVFRKKAAVTANKVFFVVYNDLDKLSNAAALDRVGVQFAAAFTPGGANPVGHGTPGINFNNHIPSNCITCHGGEPYNTTAGTANSGPIRNQRGSLFLPFDLDQFDFDATHPRNETAFRDLNKIVWTAANLSGSTIDLNSSVKNQINDWYNKTAGSTGNLSGNFTQVVPADWSSPQGALVYSNVIRSACRNCHMTNDKATLHFDKESDFKIPANLTRAVGDLCSLAMPHSIQSLRQFWQSTQPAALEAYLRSPAGANNATLANALRDCTPGNAVTLDPPLITAVVGGP